LCVITDIGRRPKLHNTNEDYGVFLVDVRTDLHTCFLGGFIAEKVRVRGTHDRGEITTKGMCCDYYQNMYFICYTQLEYNKSPP
jgi:hypothetical protein